MKRCWLTILVCVWCSAAAAQDAVPKTCQNDLAGPNAFVNVLLSAGQPESFFMALYGSCLVVSFYRGVDHDLTYSLDEDALITVQFFEGEAGLFRLVTRESLATAEALPSLLGLDIAQLELVEDAGVKKVWRGHIGAVAFDEVAAITGHTGWNTAVVKVAGYPHR